MSAEYFSAFPQAADPLGYPLDELLIIHRLTQERAIELHRCGIVRGGWDGEFVCRAFGGGESTTTRLWTAREEMEVLSDDRIIVRRDEGGLGTPWGNSRGCEVQGSFDWLTAWLAKASRLGDQSLRSG